MYEELVAELGVAAADQDTKVGPTHKEFSTEQLEQVTVLTGAGRYFSSGNDLRSFSGWPSDPVVRQELVKAKVDQIKSAKGRS